MVFTGAQIEFSIVNTISPTHGDTSWYQFIMFIFFYCYAYFLWYYLSWANPFSIYNGVNDFDIQQF